MRIRDWSSYVCSSDLRGLRQVLPDRVRRRPAGPPADRPWHDRRQRVLQGLGDDGAAPDRAAQGQVGDRAVSDGAPRLRPSGRVVQRIPGDIRAVGKNPELARGEGRMERAKRNQSLSNRRREWVSLRSTQPTWGGTHTGGRSVIGRENVIN